MGDYHVYDHQLAVVLWSNAEERESERDGGECQLSNLLKTYGEAGLGIALAEKNGLIQSLDAEGGPLFRAIQIHQLDVPITIWAELKENSAIHKVQFRDAVYDKHNCRLSQAEFIAKFPVACGAFSHRIFVDMFVNEKLPLRPTYPFPVMYIAGFVTPNEILAIWATMSAQRKIIHFHHQDKKFGGFSNFYGEPSQRLGVSYTFVVPSIFFAEGMLSEMSLLRMDRYIDIAFAHKAIVLCKAAIHGDVIAFDRISKASTPKECTEAGREIKNLNQELWDSMIRAVTYEVVYQKFTKVPQLKDLLLSTGNDVIANATRNDVALHGPCSIWGISIMSDDRNIPIRKNDNSVPGTNILGWAIMSVRSALHAHPGYRHSEIELITSGCHDAEYERCIDRNN